MRVDGYQIHLFRDTLENQHLRIMVKVILILYMVVLFMVIIWKVIILILKEEKTNQKKNKYFYQVKLLPKKLIIKTIRLY